MPIDFVGGRCGFPVLRFVATLKATRDLGLDPQALNAVALQFDPRKPDLDGVADELAAPASTEHAGAPGSGLTAPAC